MATRLYRLNFAEDRHTVTEAVGSGVTKNVELTVDFDAVGMSKEQAIIALQKLQEYIATSIWPPA